MHYYKRNIGDYHKKAGKLSILEHGAYTLLIDACYDREQYPTKEQAIDWVWARTADEVASVEFILIKFFTLEDGVYKQKRIEEELAKYHENSITNKRIAKEREEKKRTERERSVNGASPDDHEPAPNHKPLTTNQEPRTNTYVDQQVDLVEDAISKPKKEIIPYGKIIDLYHSKLPMLSQVFELTDTRKSKIKTLWNDGSLNDLEGWEKYFNDIATSPFLTGRIAPTNGRAKPWRADIDFIINKNNYVKIAEGKYDV